MRRLITAVALLLPLMPAPLAAQGLTRAQMEEDLRQYAAVTKQSWAYVQEKQEQFGVNVDRILAQALARLGSVQSADDFADLLDEFTASLKDGHASAPTGHLRGRPVRLWPFSVREVAEGIVVDGLDPALGPAPGLARGDLLLRVDGRPIEELIEQACRRVPASTDTARRHRALRDRAYWDSWLGRTEAGAVTVTFRDAAGRVGTVQVKTVPPSTPAPPPFVRWRLLEGDVGYLQVTTFYPNAAALAAAKTTQEVNAVLAPSLRELDRAWRRVAGCGALVLDLRGNGGGNDSLGMHLAEHFLPPRSPYYHLQTRYSPALAQSRAFPGIPSAGWGPKQVVVPSALDFLVHYSGPRYAGGLAILADEGCFHATDNFLGCVADLLPSVRVVGRPTNGGTGAPTHLTTLTHSRAAVRLCVMKVWTPKGHLIEGRGTRPHVGVAWSRRDVVEGADPDLRAALKELAGTPHGG